MSQTEKWTELEHLPEWDEEFYEVYTAKKHGKWVMLKTLRPEFRDNPEYRAMMEREFDVRYNLCHPNIVMINDFEEVPGLGMCIITDDVYGTSLRKMIDKGEVTPEIQEKVIYGLLDAIAYIQKNHIVHHPIRPETIIFTENIGNLKIIDVGFDQHSQLSPAAAADDLRDYGKVLEEVLDATGDTNPRLRAVARRCRAPKADKRYRDSFELRSALQGQTDKRLYVVAIAFLLVMIAILGWFCWKQPAL